jgi:hypothetical protein
MPWPRDELEVINFTIKCNTSFSKSAVLPYSNTVKSL